MKVRVVFSNTEQGIKCLEMSYRTIAQIILNKITTPEKESESIKPKEEKIYAVKE